MGKELETDRISKVILELFVMQNALARLQADLSEVQRNMARITTMLKVLNEPPQEIDGGLLMSSCYIHNWHSVNNQCPSCFQTITTTSRCSEDVFKPQFTAIDTPAIDAYIDRVGKDYALGACNLLEERVLLTEAIKEIRALLGGKR
jgi:hypothetical protein